MTPKRGLVFQLEIIEDDTLFFDDKLQTTPRGPRYKKKCVVTDPEGGAWTAPLAPRLYFFNSVSYQQVENMSKNQFSFCFFH